MEKSNKRNRKMLQKNVIRGSLNVVKFALIILLLQQYVVAAFKLTSSPSNVQIFTSQHSAAKPQIVLPSLSHTTLQKRSILHASESSTTAYSVPHSSMRLWLAVALLALPALSFCFPALLQHITDPTLTASERQGWIIATLLSKRIFLYSTAFAALQLIAETLSRQSSVLPLGQRLQTLTKDIFGIDFLPVSPSSEQTLTSEEDDVLPANTEDDKEEDEIEQENKMWLQTLDNVSEKKTALLLPVALATLLTLSYGTISVSGSLAAFLSSTISSSSPNSEQALLLKNIVLPTLITLPTLSISYFFSKYEVSNIFSSVINEKQSRVLSQVMAVLLVALSYSSWSVGGGLWSVHNIVNMCIAVTMSRLLQLEQLPFIVLALLGLTVYDVVAVFGTQQLTDGGQSIMEAVATAKISTASSAAPTIPSVDQASISSIASNWQWPKFRPWSPGLFEVSLNRRISDGLGLADVIFPSLLLTWAKRKEMITPPKVSAATACSTGFLIGCLMCEVFQTGQGQPALVFIVPSMLISLGLAVTTDSILKPKPEV